jgi:RNA-directed DNA polymerase
MTSFESYFDVDTLKLIVASLLDCHFDVISERPRISTGADRIELDLFLRDQDMHISSIGRKVIEGRFTFSPFLEQEIPKADSKDMRTISIASIRDSIVQRALYEYLYPTIDAMLSPSVFGYRKGYSAHDAVRKVREEITSSKVFIFDADLRKFFDTVDHDILLTMVGNLSVDERAKTLIRRFLKTGKIPSSQVAEHKAMKGRQVKYAPAPRTIGVPQGGVLSGLLSNLYLSQFDAAIREHHIGLVRYADDFLVCCQSAEECKKVHAQVKEELVPLRVELNPDKSKECVSADSGVDFLGFRISTRGLRIRGRNVSKFKVRIHGVVANQKVHNTATKTLRSLVRRLQFKIRGPDIEQLKKLAERGKRVLHCRRSWIGYFRIVDDLTQVKSLDRWLRRQVSAFIWDKHRCRVSFTHMKAAGMPSLVNSMWKARSTKEPPKKETDVGQHAPDK